MTKTVAVWMTGCFKQREISLNSYNELKLCILIYSNLAVPGVIERIIINHI